MSEPEPAPIDERITWDGDELEDVTNEPEGDPPTLPGPRTPA